MKLEVTELGPLERAVKIEVPAEDVTKRFEMAYADLNRQVRIPGFRPGKAPRALLEKRYAEAVEGDLLRSLIPEYYQRAMKETGFSPVSVDIPPLERITLKQGAPLVFTANVELKPTVTLQEYRGFTLEQDARSITEEQVDKALEVLQNQHAPIEPLQEDRETREGDYVQIEVTAYEGDRPLAEIPAEKHLIPVGDQTPVLGVVLGPALLAQKKGAVIEVSQTFPAEHDDARMAGKTVTIRGTIEEVKTKTLPVLDDEFAKDLGNFETLAELRQKVKAQLEQGLQHDIEEGYKQFCVKRLVELHQFEVPESLVQRELEAMIRGVLDRRRRWAQAQGSPEALPPVDVQQLREQFLPTAQERVKLGLILEAIAEKEELTVTEADVDRECRLMARAMKLEPMEVKKLLLAGGQDTLADLKSRILTDKALQFVYQHAIIQVK